MDNNEVRVMHINGEKANKTTKGGEIYDGYLQRKAYFVIPQIDKLRNDKIKLK